MPPADSTEGCAAHGPSSSSCPNDANCEARCRHDMWTSYCQEALARGFG